MIIIFNIIMVGVKFKKKKGLSPVIAIVLLIVIVIGAVALFYSWYSVTQKQAQAGAGAQVAAVTGSAQKTVEIVEIRTSPASEGHVNINLTARVTGAQSIRMILRNTNDDVDPTNCAPTNQRVWEDTGTPIPPLGTYTFRICGIAGQLNRLQFEDAAAGNLTFFVYDYVP